MNMHKEHAYLNCTAHIYIVINELLLSLRAYACSAEPHPVEVGEFRPYTTKFGLKLAFPYRIILKKIHIPINSKNLCKSKIMKLYIFKITVKLRITTKTLKKKKKKKIYAVRK